MADVKISELPVATTAETPDVVPIVQSGVTKQIDVRTFKRSKNLYFYGELYDSVFIRGITPDLAIGDNDIYVVPTDRSALITGSRIWNDSGGSVTAFAELKHSGTYYRISNSATIANGAGSSAVTIAGGGIIISAGDSFAINAATTAGANALYSIIEFADQSQLKSSFLFGTSSGDNTLYTVPADKTAMPIPFSVTIGGQSSVFAFGAGAVGTGNIVPKISQSGGSPIVTLATSGGASANVAGSSVHNSLSLEAGDSVILNITTGDTAQIAWGVFLELDA